MNLIPTFIRRIHDTRKAKNIITDIRENFMINGAFHTPDAPEIEAKVGHLVLFYDDMMKDRKEFSTISEYVHGHVGRAFANIAVEAYISTKTGKVIAFLSNKDSVPTWANQVGAEAAPIRGDVYLVNPQAIFVLDKLFGNNVYCERVLVDCDRWRYKTYWSEFYNRTHKTPLNFNTIKAWIYLGIPEKWDIDGGYTWKPLHIYRSRNKFKPDTYYFHSYRRSPLVPQN